MSNTIRGSVEPYYRYVVDECVSDSGVVQMVKDFPSRGPSVCRARFLASSSGPIKKAFTLAAMEDIASQLDWGRVAKEVAQNG